MNKRKLNEIETELNEIKLEKEELILRKNTKIEIKKNKEYNIKIENNLTLEIISEKKTFSKINIEVKDNLKIDLIQYISNKETSIEFNVNLEKKSKLNISQIIFNNKYLKNIVNLKEKSKYKLKSAYLNESSDSIIINSSNNLKKESETNLSIKGAAKESSNINNDGIVFIHKDAFKSVGHQSLKNIILDKTTKINSEPILEIHNNQVSCSHGCSTSKIEEESLNYIQSRGIDINKATKLILEGFFYESTGLINNEKIKEKLESKVEKKLKKVLK